MASYHVDEHGWYILDKEKEDYGPGVSTPEPSNSQPVSTPAATADVSPVQATNPDQNRPTVSANPFKSVSDPSLGPGGAATAASGAVGIVEGVNGGPGVSAGGGVSAGSGSSYPVATRTVSNKEEDKATASAQSYSTGAQGLSVDDIVQIINAINANKTEPSLEPYTSYAQTSPSLDPYKSYASDKNTTRENAAYRNLRDMERTEMARPDVGPYNSQYESQIQSILDSILNDKGFDINNDKNYQSLYDNYAQVYRDNARKAMQSSMGAASSLNGGYGSSYSQAAGQQAYDNTMAGLSGANLQLMELAYQIAQNDRANRYNQLSAVEGLENTDYGRYIDDRNFVNNNFESDRNFNENTFEADRNYYLNLYNDLLNQTNYEDSVARSQYAADRAQANYEDSAARGLYQDDRSQANFETQLGYNALLDALNQQYKIDDRDYQRTMAEQNAAYEQAAAEAKAINQQREEAIKYALELSKNGADIPESIMEAIGPGVSADYVTALSEAQKAAANAYSSRYSGDSGDKKTESTENVPSTITSQEGYKAYTDGLDYLKEYLEGGKGSSGNGKTETEAYLYKKYGGQVAAEALNKIFG